MRYLLALAPLALLAACGGNKAANNSAAKATNTATTNAAAPAAAPVTMAPAAPAAPAAGGARADMVAECTTAMGRGAPPGVDIGALCNCAVDKVTSGATQDDAARSCAAELGIPVPPEE